LNAPTEINVERTERLEGILAALRRARRRAEDIAIVTGTELVESDGGKVVLVSPSEILARREKANGGA
jgi:hypothetical protein